MFVAAVLVVASLPIFNVANRVMADFGYPDFVPDRSTRTASGGWVFESGATTLRVDSEGRPRDLKTRGVKFERSNAAAAERKVQRLLQRYPLSLPPGQWMTEPGNTDLFYGKSSSSFRYSYVPILHGYRFLGASQMTIQFSSDLKRVIEWSYHPSGVASAALPKSLLTRSQALRLIGKRAFARVGSAPNAWVEVVEASLQLGWLHPNNPQLAYTCKVWYRRKLAYTTPGMGTTRGVGDIALIDASTGAPLKLH
jgi:hypothetical protein